MTDKDKKFLMEDLSNFKVKETFDGLRPTKSIAKKKTKIIESKKPIQIKKEEILINESGKEKVIKKQKDEYSDIFNNLK